MASYDATVRTNYFAVKDEDRLREIIGALSSEDEVLLFEREFKDGKKFGFGCYGAIYGLVDPDDEDGDPLDIAVAIQSVVSENDAAIIMEAGHEKLRFVSGHCTVVTSNGIQVVDMREQAIKLSRKMLENQNYDTQMEY